MCKLYMTYENTIQRIVYDYTLDIIPEMEKDGWKLLGTYVRFCIFYKEVEDD